MLFVFHLTKWTVRHPAAIQIFSSPSSDNSVVCRHQGRRVRLDPVVAINGTNMIIKMTILRLLGSNDDKEKIGVARPEGPPLRGFRYPISGRW